MFATKDLACAGEAIRKGQESPTNLRGEDQAMSNEVNVSLMGSGVIIPPTSTHQWFYDFAPGDYNQARKRVRTFSVVPYVHVEESDSSGPDRPLGIPEDSFPGYEQRVEISSVFHLVKARTAQLQVNVIVRSLTPGVPVAYVLMMAETDN